jgi:predicted GNAT family acetyltransferase
MISGPDNPVWEALSTVQSHFNQGNDRVKYLPPEVGPFIGLKDWDQEDLKDLVEYIPVHRSFSVMIAKQITLPSYLRIVLTLPLYQMYCPHLIPFPIKDLTPRRLTKEDIGQMLSLTSKTKPGPFLERTIEFGDYLGLFSDNTLIAMAGERLKTEGFTEVSAICTDQAHLGKGYASFLCSLVCEQIFGEGKIPFLHVRQDNTRAIEVYKKLGFRIRADVYFAIFKKS